MDDQSSFDPELFFSALADRTRLRLLNLMRDGEVCVCFLAETLETNDPKISRHLAYLRRANLVVGRREGKWMHYRINEPGELRARQLLHQTLDLIGPEPQMQNDRERLIKVCCPPTVRISRDRS